MIIVVVMYDIGKGSIEFFLKNKLLNLKQLLNLKSVKRLNYGQ